MEQRTCPSIAASTCTELGYPMAIGDALLGSGGTMATASLETADWGEAAMAGKAIKPGVKVAKETQVEMALLAQGGRDVYGQAQGTAVPVPSGKT